MESKVKLSTYSMILTSIVVILLLTAVTLLLIHSSHILSIMFCLFLLGGLLWALLKAPVSIKVNKENIEISNRIDSLIIPISKIKGVELFQPTMGATNLCASGGFMGYYGYFKEGDVGKYYAYYGKSSDCFLVRMKNGDKYVLGCENHDAMMAYIDSQLVK